VSTNEEEEEQKNNINASLNLSIDDIKAETFSV